MRQHNPHPAVAARHVGIIDPEIKHFNGRINLDHDALELPLTIKKPTVFAVWDDLFYGDGDDRAWCAARGVEFEPVPIAFIAKAFAFAAISQQHTFVLLTKRAQRMHEIITNKWFRAEVEAVYRINARYSLGLSGDARSWPLPNVIGMVTAENQEQANARIPWLLRTPFAMRGVSVEPMLESIDMSYWLFACQTCDARPGEGDPSSWRFDGKLWQHHHGYPIGHLTTEAAPLVDGLFCGAETGPHKRPMQLDWARSMRDQCSTAGVPFFFKRDSSGSRQLDGRTWDEMPEVSR